MVSTSDDDDLDDAQAKAVNVRFYRQAFEHLPGIGGRLAAIAVRKGLLKGVPTRNISPQLVEVLSAPRHASRMQGPLGPYLVYRTGQSSVSLFDLVVGLLHPERDVRAATLDELKRQISQHQQLVSPLTRAEIDKHAANFASSDENSALASAIQLADVLEGDFFFAAARMRQVSAFNILEDLPVAMDSLLRPHVATLAFLARHPLANKQTAISQLTEKCSSIVASALSLEDLLTQYFFYFGFVPLGAEFSAGALVDKWFEAHKVPGDLWQQVSDWASPFEGELAKYHACQVLIGRAADLSEQHRTTLSKSAWRIVKNERSNPRAQRRLLLAQHFLRHFSLSTWGDDGELSAVFSWWFAEYVGALLNSMSSATLAQSLAECDAIIESTAQLWRMGRPAATPSRLRTATMFSPSPWSRAILVGLANSPVSELIELCKDETTDKDDIPTYVPLPTENSDYVPFAFDAPDSAVIRHLAQRQQRQSALSWLNSAVSVEAESSDVVMSHWNEILLHKGGVERAAVVEIFRQWASLGAWDTEPLWKSCESKDGRLGLLGDHTLHSEMLDGLTELLWHDSKHEWKSYLPHFLALLCQDNRLGAEARKLVIGSLFSVCITTGTSSALERLGTWQDRRLIRSEIDSNRQALSNLFPIAPPWLAARVRMIRPAIS